MMALIFGFSSRTSNELPDFGLMDFSIKKFGHMAGYALLAVSYLYGLNNKRPWLAWLLAVLYAASDEFHQSFVAGRHPSPVDVLLFDNLGAILGLAISHWFAKWKQKGGTFTPPSKAH